jgi:REP element-mobilizing transposase RayT
MNRGRRGETIFPTKEDYKTFIELLEELSDLYNVKVAAYCLMPNHYHLLLQTPYANLSRAMRHVNGVYTQRYNRAHVCDGQLFRGRYKSIIVDADSYLLELVRYIHRNPREAGLVQTVNQYPWSSHKGYLSHAKRWDWLHKDFVLSLLSKNKTESMRIYKQFVAKDTPEEITQIFGKRKLPSVVGSEKFVDKIKGMFFTNTTFEEVPESRYLAPDVERINAEVCRFYKIEPRDLYTSRRGYFNEPRNTAIYLVRYLRGDSLKEIGKAFEIGKYSTVSSVIERVKKEIRKDISFNKRVEQLISKLAKSQRQT